MFKNFFLIALYSLIFISVAAQEKLKGKVLSNDYIPIESVTIRSIISGQSTRTAFDGTFVIKIDEKRDSLLFTAVGYDSKIVAVTNRIDKEFIVFLSQDTRAIEEVQVMSTGYYRLPKERLTGSFEHVSEKQLQESAHPNIIGRLEGIVSGLQFDRSEQTREETGGFNVRIRGLSTIDANQSPLIIWDGFPFEGRIEDINPDVVANVTVLKDAAASSIWGARAGNGVIVIESKKGREGKTMINYSANMGIQQKPNLFYSPNKLDASEVMEIQKKLFLNEAYTERIQTMLPNYVELLIAQRDGLISEQEFAKQEARFLATDLRREATEYLYRNQLNQQHNLSLSGGGKGYRYYISGFYQGEKAAIKGNESSNVGFSINNQFNLFKGNELSLGVNYARQHTSLNGVPFNELGYSGYGPDIYDQLLTENGEFAAVPQLGIRSTLVGRAEEMGLVDWAYRPLQEQQLKDRTQESKSLMLQFGMKQEVIPGWNVQFRYQYTSAQSDSRELFDKDSHHVRDLVNRLTDTITLKRVIPYQGVLEIGQPQLSSGHRFRLQSDFQHSFDWGGELNILAGTEISKTESWRNPGSRVYNYDKDLGMGSVNYDFDKLYNVWLNGNTIKIPSLGVSRIGGFGRDLSYYSNIAYSHKQKYVLSGSLRWDGSNLFGVEANKRGAPLWSVGAAWSASEDVHFLSQKGQYLRFRATYGVAGNVDRTQSSYPTISYVLNNVTGLQSASLSHPGNPFLSWEKVSTLNFGLDWKAYRVSGSIEPYWKKASNLLGNILADPTQGTSSFANYKVNYADMETKGLDVKLNIDVMQNRLKWNASFLYSYVYNEIGNFKGNDQVNSNVYFARRIPVNGKSLDMIYALPWNGLSPENGLPIVYIDGEQSIDYRSYYRNYKPEELIDAGVTVAPHFMHMQNQFEFKHFSLNIITAMRWGHVFRRSSMIPGGELEVTLPRYHRDYRKRWQKPGDENTTIVPAAIDATDGNLVSIAMNNESLIEKADVFRIQQINIGYNFPKSWLASLGVENIVLFADFYNVGILYRATKEKLDPDFPKSEYPAPFQFTTGLRLQL